jgi:hypothetical protein
VTPGREINLHCSFCGAHQREVKKLIAGPTVYICDRCVFDAWFEPDERGACSFCGRSEISVHPGKEAVICEECVALCVGILRDEGAAPPDRASHAIVICGGKLDLEPRPVRDPQLASLRFGVRARTHDVQVRAEFQADRTVLERFLHEVRLLRAYEGTDAHLRTMGPSRLELRLRPFGSESRVEVHLAMKLLTLLSGGRIDHDDVALLLEATFEDVARLEVGLAGWLREFFEA